LLQVYDLSRRGISMRPSKLMVSLKRLASVELKEEEFLSVGFLVKLKSPMIIQGWSMLAAMMIIQGLSTDFSKLVDLHVNKGVFCSTLHLCVLSLMFF